MAIEVHDWQITVTLIKLVQRQGSIAAAFTAAQRTIDLTPFLGEASNVKTVKNTASPAGGFTIVLTDQEYGPIRDTVYAVLEPMDMIEIRASRQPWKFVGQKLPLIMRGFISTVHRTEAMGDDGKPQRAVVIQGLDAGKLWQIHKVLFQIEYATGQAFLTTFKMQSSTGINVKALDVVQFMQQITQYLNTKIIDFSAYTKKLILPFTVQAGTVPGRAFVQMVSDVEGALWGYVETFADRPWNEVFTRDTEEGPVLIFREVPFYDINNKLIMPNAVDPGRFDVEAKEIVTLDVARSDDRVANFFWVPPGQSMLDNQQQTTAAALATGQPIDAGYGNDTSAIYGERIMDLPTKLVPDEVNILPTMLPPGDQAVAAGQYTQWHTLRSEQLKATNRDNCVFEEGTMTFMGSEAAACGQYAQVRRGGVTWSAYVPQVSHSFTPFGAWLTTATLVRGTGFLVRDGLPGSPYWSEGRDGPYTVKGKGA